ncbi:YceI family protein [Yoonia sediminilitoris]|uniref:Polyisoprenoid-binding protein YceI n=1 Tax=Yoonia sediminilitoris TaxID=1286148 RepID=A0A2T6KDN2_9RHOB|nr:YceI family protein [Yoonia sediminilitoris]PUB13146.1 polyisoprenoid-binding protein YceI [Yoonia sediminilitoris]RCW94481.1 polyisoprenoid-binding protein YceI [Yoonia sediminilitoris]
MKKFLIAAALVIAGFTTQAAASSANYVLDASHSQVLFSYNHLGYSTTYGPFSGIEGTINFNQEDPAASRVSVPFPVRSMFTGWEERFNHFISDDFFGADEDEMVIFTSTSIEVTGDTTALNTCDLTLNGATKPVVLDAKMNQSGEHPMAKKPWAGFDATATILRSDFEVGAFAPFVSDEVALNISIEATVAE